MKKTEWYPLPKRFDPASLSVHSEKLGITLIHQSDSSETLSLFDTFDWRLANDKKILLYRQGALWLIDGNNFSCLAVNPAVLPKGDFQPQLFASVIPERTAASIYPRVLFKRLTFQLQLSEYEVRDDEEKLTGHFLLYKLAPADENRQAEKSLKQWLTTCPLNGYDKSLRSVCEGLTSVRPLKSHPVEDFLLEQVRERASSGYKSKPKLKFSANTPGRELLQNSLTANLKIALTNIDGISKDRDTEFLHDFRVALRRMRAQLSLLKGIYYKTCNQQMRDILGVWARPTNTLRDLDVWLLEADHYYSLLPSAFHPGLKELTEVLTKQRQQQVRKVRSFLLSSELTQQQQRLISLITNNDTSLPAKSAELPAWQLADKTFNQHCRHIVQLCSKTHQQSQDQEIHSVRIECKKLRYLSELFKPIASRDSWTAVTRHLKMLQDELGHFNDLSVQQEFLNTQITPLIEKQQLSNAAILATGALLALLNTKQLQEKQKILANLSAFAQQLQQPDVKTLFSARQKKGKLQEPRP